MGISLEQEIEDLKEQLSELNLEDGARQAGKKIQEYAQENPWQVAGLAAAAGFLLATLLISKKSKE